MKIIQTTQASMVLKDNNFRGIILGIVFVVVGLFGLTQANPFKNPLSWGTGIPVIFAIIGFTAVAMSRFTTIILDKGQNIISISSISILGKKLKNYALNTVIRLELREEYRMVSSSSNSRGASIETPQLNWQLVFILNDGQEVPLDHVSSGSQGGLTSVIMGGSGTERSIGQQIASFLNIQYQEISPSIQNPITTQNIPPANPTPPVTQT